MCGSRTTHPVLIMTMCAYWSLPGCLGVAPPQDESADTATERAPARVDHLGVDVSPTHAIAPHPELGDPILKVEISRMSRAFYASESITAYARGTVCEAIDMSTRDDVALYFAPKDATVLAVTGKDPTQCDRTRDAAGYLRDGLTYHECMARFTAAEGRAIHGYVWPSEKAPHTDALSHRRAEAARQWLAAEMPEELERQAMRLPLKAYGTSNSDAPVVLREGMVLGATIGARPLQYTRSVGPVLPEATREGLHDFTARACFHFSGDVRAPMVSITTHLSEDGGTEVYFSALDGTADAQALTDWLRTVLKSHCAFRDAPTPPLPPTCAEDA